MPQIDRGGSRARQSLRPRQAQAGSAERAGGGGAGAKPSTGRQSAPQARSTRAGNRAPGDSASDATACRYTSAGLATASGSRGGGAARRRAGKSPASFFEDEKPRARFESGREARPRQKH